MLLTQLQQSELNLLRVEISVFIQNEGVFYLVKAHQT
jgi:hypothetical protein